MAGFVAELDPLNAIADAAPGFLWRLQTEEGNATSIHAFDDDLLLINMSVWESVDALATYVYGPDHVAVMRRRRGWAERVVEGYLVVGGGPAGRVPADDQAEEGPQRPPGHGAAAPAAPLHARL